MMSRLSLFNRLRTDLSVERRNELLDAYAIELAEKLREFIGPEEYPGESEHVKRYVLGWHDAANMIDPRVEK